MELAQPFLAKHERQIDYLVDGVRSLVVSLSLLRHTNRQSLANAITPDCLTGMLGSWLLCCWCR